MPGVALARYARISALPLHAEARSCMVAASGSAAAAYGIAAAPITAHEVGQLRAAAARASWRGSTSVNGKISTSVYAWPPLSR